MSAAHAVDEHGAGMASSDLEDLDPRRSWRLSALPPATLSIEGPTPAPPTLPIFSHGVKKERSSSRKAKERKSSEPPHPHAHRRRSGSRLVASKGVQHHHREGLVKESVAVHWGYKELDIRDLPQPPQMILHPVVVFEPPAVEGIPQRHLSLPDTLHYIQQWRAKVEEDVGSRLAPLPALPNNIDDNHSTTTTAAAHPHSESGATCSIADCQSRTDTYLRLDGFVERRRPVAFVPAAPPRAMKLPLNVPLPPLIPEPPKETENKPPIFSTPLPIKTPTETPPPPPSPPPPPPPPPPVVEPVTIPSPPQLKVEPEPPQPEPEPEVKPPSPPQEEAPPPPLLPPAPEVEGPPPSDVTPPDEPPPPLPEIPVVVTPVKEPPVVEPLGDEKKEEGEGKTEGEEGGVVLSGELTQSNAPSEHGEAEAMVVNPIETTAGEEGPENDGCDFKGEQLEGSGDDVVVTPQAVVECKRIIQKWTKASIRITRIQRMYYKFAHAFKAGVVKTRTYCVVFHDGEDLDYVSLLTSHRTEIARPQNDPEFPKSRINCNFNHSVILPFDASSPVLRIAVVLVMAKKDEKAETGEFMRRVAGITKPLNVEKYRERMAEVNAWPLYVPQEVMGSTATEDPTIVGLVYFALTGHAGAEGPQLVPDKVLSASFDFHANRPKEAPVEVAPKKRPWYELLNPFKPHQEEPVKNKEPPEALDSMSRIPLPPKHKPAYLQLLAAAKTAESHKPQIALHSIESVDPVKAKLSFEEGSLQPPSNKAKKGTGGSLQPKTNRSALTSSTSSVGEKGGGSSQAAPLLKAGKSSVFPTPPPANSSSASFKKSVSKFGPAPSMASQFAAASKEREKAGKKTEKASLIVKKETAGPPKAGLEKMITSKISMMPEQTPEKRSYLQAASSSVKGPKEAKASGTRVRVTNSPKTEV